MGEPLNEGRKKRTGVVVCEEPPGIVCEYVLLRRAHRRSVPRTRDLVLLRSGGLVPRDRTGLLKDKVEVKAM